MTVFLITGVRTLNVFKKQLKRVSLIIPLPSRKNMKKQEFLKTASGKMPWKLILERD